jgi:anhydro-N-acetylmuramic acid kinase
MMTIAIRRHPITKLLARSHLHVLGINTGTSIDALDLALVKIGLRGGRPRLLQTASYRVPANLRRTLRQLATDATVSKKDVAQTHFRFGAQIAACVDRFRRSGPADCRIDLIGCHGQTIGHFPAPPAGSRAPKSATWQIGAAAVIAQRTGIVTIGDFRAADIAAGGMGAPLSGYYHYLLFGTEHVVLNLGGIANISTARTRRGNLEILAFDTGPGNMVIDAVSVEVLKRPFDRNGDVAGRGEADPAIVNRALRDSYFRRRPPKSCGREEFGIETARRWFGHRLRARTRVADTLATAAVITATSVAKAVTRWIEPYTSSRSLILTGGGTRNATLVAMLADQNPAWSVCDSGSLGIDPQYVEPMGFAVLAGETIFGRPGNRGGATGGGPAILGSLSLPIGIP